MRGSRGPRQPGGGKQSLGRGIGMVPVIRRCERSEPPSRLLPTCTKSSKSGKPDGRGHGPGPLRALRALSSPQAGRSASGACQERVAGPRILQASSTAASGGPQTAALFDTVSLRRSGEPVGRRKMPTTVQNVAVTGDEAGMRVDRFLEARFPGLSFSHIQRVIRKGEVRVNGKRTQPKNRLEAGQTVRIPPLRLDQPKPRAPGNEADEKTRAFLKSITLYDDADVLVLNKPMGLAVQGGSGTTRHVDGMLEVLRDAHGQRPRLVHRLDKDTAGCLLVAKTRFAAAALAKTFRSRSARKIYWALVASVPKVQQGRISTYLVKEEREDESLMRIARHGEKGASHAVTYYAVVETSGPLLSWLSLKPVTGRTHQLRAHMAHINHPIVGDPKYFSRENWELPGGMQNKLHLLARRIVVPHPRGGMIDATAPLPPHMQQSWNLLGLDAARYDPIVEAPEE